MTPSQRKSLVRVARLCAKHGNWGPLEAWVSAFSERTRSSLDREPPPLPQRLADDAPAPWWHFGIWR
jgi:hypothetical protein